jgi:hypothetical protein
MAWPYKVLAGLLLLVVSFLAGYFSRQPETIVKTETKIEYVDKVKVERVVVTEREEKPDGTKTEKVTETESSTSRTKVKTDENKVAPSLQISAANPQYSLGVEWTPDWRDLSWQPTGASAGYRLVGDVWGEARYDWKRGEVTIGLRYEW